MPMRGHILTLTFPGVIISPHIICRAQMRNHRMAKFHENVVHNEVVSCMSLEIDTIPMTAITIIVRLMKIITENFALVGSIEIQGILARPRQLAPKYPRITYVTEFNGMRVSVFGQSNLQIFKT